MSQAILCDRCGVYEPQMVDGKNPYHREWIQVSANDAENPYSLCASCAEEFNVFMKGDNK